MAEIAQKQKDLALKAERIPSKRIRNLFPLICQRAWMLQAMWNVLHNKGAETPGVDGKIKAAYYDAKTRSLTAKAVKRVEELCESLGEGSYRPKPVRRIYIPKTNGKVRPIGIPTLDDRIVQEAIRMVLEPIYESDFLNCSYGFRPNRRAMDAISVCYRRIYPGQKYYWVIEGDIKGCFDQIDHKILMKLLRKRIADRSLTDTIYKFLKAGYRENGMIHKPDVGTPQGGVISPLLANVYLHELDKWWSRSHELDRYGKTIRRGKHLGNFALIRYCDDFIMLSNGTKQATEDMKEEVAKFLRDELRLELSQEKTAITHAFDGFDFLGFHIRKHKSRKGVIIKPAKHNVQKMQDRIDRILNRKTHSCAVVNIIRVLKPIVLGWSNYYRFVNSAGTFQELDFYLKRKFLKWYRGKYRMPKRKGTVATLEWVDRDGLIHLAQFGETEVKRYRWQRKSNPYTEMKVKRNKDYPFPKQMWNGSSKRNADLRLRCLQRDDGICQICMRPKTNLIAHHILPLSKGGTDTLGNLTAICRDCHRSYHRELHYECLKPQEIKRLVESRDAVKVARPVR